MANIPMMYWTEDTKVSNTVTPFESVRERV